VLLELQEQQASPVTWARKEMPEPLDLLDRREIRDHRAPLAKQGFREIQDILDPQE
jgi:hypothetical protein